MSRIFHRYFVSRAFPCQTGSKEHHQGDCCRDCREVFKRSWWSHDDRVHDEHRDASNGAYAQRHVKASFGLDVRQTSTYIYIYINVDVSGRETPRRKIKTLELSMRDNVCCHGGVYLFRSLVQKSHSLGCWRGRKRG
jgi:hypothetical protein